MERYLVGMLAGVALAMGVGYAVITVHNHHAVSPRPAPTLAQQRAQIQQEFDARMTTSANDTTLLPEVRVDALAAKVKADALFAIDTRFGTDETQIYTQQESEHWHRVIEALPHPHPKRDHPSLAWRESSDIGFDQAVNDDRADPTSRADTLAAKRKFDALFALDTLLGTDETSIFLQQEIDRDRRILTAMEALRK